MALLDKLRAALQPGSYTLAVSGGVDSMVLLDAAAKIHKESQGIPGRGITRINTRASRAADPGALVHLSVATFDHGTGPAATQAADRVAERAAALGLTCIRGHATTPGRTEAEWRRARWHFLRDTAACVHSTIITAHTRDDQVETVFMRILRDAGPRGLVALYAPSDILRPFLSITRTEILDYAHTYHITFTNDPSNATRTHLRNRIRHDLLPAIRALHPTFDEDLLALAAKSAAWRTQMDHVAATFSMMPDTSGSFYIPRTQLAGHSLEALRVLWPALAARAGVIMDRRGTHRLATFTIRGESGQSIQLSGGVDVRMRRDSLVLKKSAVRPTIRGQEPAGD